MEQLQAGSTQDFLPYVTLKLMEAERGRASPGLCCGTVC